MSRWFILVFVLFVVSSSCTKKLTQKDFEVNKILSSAGEDIIHRVSLPFVDTLTTKLINEADLELFFEDQSELLLSYNWQFGLTTASGRSGFGEKLELTAEDSMIIGKSTYSVYHDLYPVYYVDGDKQSNSANFDSTRIYDFQVRLLPSVIQFGDMMCTYKIYEDQLSYPVFSPILDSMFYFKMDEQEYILWFLDDPFENSEGELSIASSIQKGGRDYHQRAMKFTSTLLNDWSLIKIEDSFERDQGSKSSSNADDLMNEFHWDNRKLILEKDSRILHFEDYYNDSFYLEPNQKNRTLYRSPKE